MNAQGGIDSDFYRKPALPVPPYGVGAPAPGLVSRAARGSAFSCSGSPARAMDLARQNSSQRPGIIFLTIIFLLKKIKIILF